MLGIIGAMDREVAQLKSEMENPEITTVAGMEFYKGFIHGKEIVVVQSGIGKVNAGICVQILADRFQVSGIVNTGIAGSLNAQIDIGDVVLSTDAVQHDMDLSAWGYAVGQIPHAGVFAFPADEKLRKIAKEYCLKVNPDTKVFEGRVVTGDQFISDKGKKQWLIDTFQGFCTEMEGGAIAQAAYMNHIPYLIIRVISDKADDSADTVSLDFESMACERSSRLTYALIAAFED